MNKVNKIQLYFIAHLLVINIIKKKKEKKTQY